MMDFSKKPVSPEELDALLRNARREVAKPGGTPPPLWWDAYQVQLAAPRPWPDAEYTLMDRLLHGWELARAEWDADGYILTDPDNWRAPINHIAIEALRADARIANPHMRGVYVVTPYGQRAYALEQARRGESA
jgi:hypothetical protein